MKLVSLNVEGVRFAPRGLALCEELKPDIICFMEAPEASADTLRERGYSVTFAPMTLKMHEDTLYTEGVLIATLVQHTATTYYYHEVSKLTLHTKEHRRETLAHPVIVASFANFTVATTHFTWNPRGEVADENQIGDMEKLLAFLSTQPAHILCGDLNIPRFQNQLYESLIETYTDNIPLQYPTSLDKSLHRLGQDPNCNHLFASFMVDYLLTMSPYQASNVELKFGISDHAAVVAEVVSLD